MPALPPAEGEGAEVAAEAVGEVAAEAALEETEEAEAAAEGGAGAAAEEEVEAAATGLDASAAGGLLTPGFVSGLLTAGAAAADFEEAVSFEFKEAGLALELLVGVLLLIR